MKEPSKRKAQWLERSQAIHAHFPSVSRLDWYKAFKSDPTFIGQIINDVIKTDSATPGKPGKRPGVEAGEVHSLYRDLNNESYTIEPFPEAFKFLAGTRSVRHLAATLGIDRNMIHKMLGGYTPSMAVMEQVARGFKKQPEFFAEYRSLYVLGFIHHHFENNPEASMVFFRKVKTRESSNGSS